MAPVLHSFKQDVHPQLIFGYLIYAFQFRRFYRLPGQTSKHRLHPTHYFSVILMLILFILLHKFT